MPVSSRQAAIHAQADSIAFGDANWFRMVEQKMIGIFDNVRAELLWLSIVPSERFQANQAPTRVAAFPHHATPLAVLAMPAFAPALWGHLVSWRIDLSAFQNGSFLIETHAPKQGITRQTNDIAPVA